MTQTIEAIYEQGVFKPLQLVELPERQKVVLTIEAPGEGGDPDVELLQLLDEPFELGAKEPLNRRAIYDDTR